MNDAIDQADRLSRRRVRNFVILGGFLVLTQFKFFANGGHSRDGDVGIAAIWAGALIAITVLAILLTGGSWWRGGPVRSLLNDEVTRAHRASALSAGFVVMVLAAVGCRIAATVMPLETFRALHVVYSLGLGVALVRFAMLERRAHSHG